MGQPNRPYDVLTMGRVGVDLYPSRVGVALEDVATFGRYLGGSATNVAVAASRLGRRAAVITRTGDDPFGRFVHRALRDYGVDDRYVTAVPHLPTPVVFCEIFPPDDFPIYFYRWPKAPDLEIHPDQLDLAAVRDAGVFWVTGTGLSQEPSRAATLAALAERGRHGITVLDLDYRPSAWPSAAAARECLLAALPLVTLAVGNLAECAVAVGESDPLVAAEALRALGVTTAVVKLGPEGVLGLGADGVVRVPPHPVDVVNGLGAGDAFGGALCHGLLAGWPLDRALAYANVAGAIVAGKLACAPAMPTHPEVRRELASAAARDDPAGGIPRSAGTARGGTPGAPESERKGRRD